MVALQLRPDDLDLPGDDGLDAETQVGDRDLVLDRIVAAVKGPLAKAREVENAFTQSLRRNGARVDADPADHLFPVDDRHALSQLGRGDRALLPGRAGPDHHEVVRVRLRSFHVGSLAPTHRALEKAGTRPLVRPGTNLVSSVLRLR